MAAIVADFLPVFCKISQNCGFFLKIQWVFFFFCICMFTSVLGGCRARYTTAVQCLVKNTLPEIAAVGNRGAPYSLHRRFRKSTSQSRKVAARGGEPYNPLRDTSETATRRRHERHAKRQQIVSQEDFSKATMSYQQRQYPNLVSILSCFYYIIYISPER